jgi:hypothetical protein
MVWYTVVYTIQECADDRVLAEVTSRLGKSAPPANEVERLLPPISEHAVLHWRPGTTSASQPFTIDLGASPLHVLLDGMRLVLVEASE